MMINNPIYYFNKNSYGALKHKFTDVAKKIDIDHKIYCIKVKYYLVLSFSQMFWCLLHLDKSWRFELLECVGVSAGGDNHL